MDRRRAAGARARALLALALAACFATATAAPASNQTALDSYDGPTEGCYYNFQHYGEGDRIMTNEPCLNCTCHNRMLMCYLRVCPFTKPIGQDCTVEKRADQCCPIVTCPDVPVDLLTSTSTTSPAEYGGTGVGKVDNYGCSINGKYFPEGAKVPPTPNKPCEHCYCIRNMTTCVMQECTLHVDGCTPIYHKDVCCPVRYFCDHPDEETLQLDDMTTTVRPTPGFLLTTTTMEPPTTEIQTKRECTEDGQIYPDGALIKTEKPCVHCYCMKGDIVCVVQECGAPMENEGKNCTSMPPREGQCCPDTYICEGDEITTETPLEEITTMLPLQITTRRENVEGSGYRKEPGETYTETSLSFETEGSGEEELISTITSDFLTPKEPTTVNPIENKFGVTDESLSSGITTELPLYVVKEQASTEPDKGLNTVPSEISEDEYSKPSVIDHTTVQEDILTTKSSTSFVEQTSMISTSQKPGTEMPETTSSGEVTKQPTTISSVQIEDESTQTSPRGEDETTESITESEINTKLTTVPDQSNTTPSETISAETTESILTKQTTLKSDSMSEATMTETTPKEVYTVAAITDFTEHSSEPSFKEKTTTSHYIMVTESSATSEERDITSPVLQEKTTTQIPEVTESVIPTEEQTSFKEIFSEESSEPSLFDKNTSTDAITKSEIYKTTVPSIYEDTLATTTKIVKEEEKSTEQTIVENYKTTTENLVKETDATPKPLHEESFIPVVESEGGLTTEQTPEHYINNETIPTFVPSTEVVPQEEKQDTTDAIDITTSQPRDKIQPAETTTLNPEDNEINEDILPPGRIPGEGDCLFNGVTYRNESSVPNRSKCESSCKCISSIIKCNPIICSPPPEYVENCQLVYDSSDSCCPTYICDQTKETIPPQSHSQMSGTEIPTSSPSLQCSGDECELSIEKQTTVLPDLTKIASSNDCSSDGCINQIPEQVNIAGEQPEKCMDDKCTNECVNGNCQLPSSQEKPHTPPETIPQACQGPEECQQNKTENPECQGEDCISKTPTLPEISTPCEGDSCPGVSQDCTSDKCVASDSVPPEKPLGSEICSGEKDCKQSEEKDCQDDICRRNEDRIQPAIQLVPPKCTDQDCQQQQESSSPDVEITVTMPTTEQVQSESTLSPESHSTSVITDINSEKTTSIPHTTTDHRVSEPISTEASEKAGTTQAPQITEGLEGENTVPHEDITETEVHYTEQPILAASEADTDKDIMITKTTETEREYTVSPAVTESQEAFTSSPVESETQREEMFSKPPESGFDKTETEKPQTTLSEFEHKQPDQQGQYTRAPESEQPTQVTDFNTNDLHTELPVQHLSSTSIITTQKDISEVKTTPEYVEQSTILPDTTEKSGVSENIPTISEYTELPEKSGEQEGTTIPPESEKQTTKLSLFDSTNQSTTQAQEFSSTSITLITEEEMKTDLPVGFVTDSLESVKEETGTETPVSPDTILNDTESPLETVEGDKFSTETSEIGSKGTISPTFEEQTERTDSYLTSPQSIITETTRIPEEMVTPEHEIQEVEQHTEIPTTASSLSFETKLTEKPDKTIGLEIPTETTRKPEELATPEQDIQEIEQHLDTLTTESSLTLETKPSEETDKIIEPEISTETTISHISEPTETTMLQETTSEKVNLTDKPMQTETELIIPVSITEEPSVDTKETEKPLLCDSESECKKAQVQGAEMAPCQGKTCIEVKEGCHSSECSQSGLPPNKTTTEICDKESGCKKPSQEASSECTDQNCRMPAISGIEITTKTPSILDEELHTEIPSEPHVAETEVPATKAPSFDFDKTTQEPSVEESEKRVTELPESIITDTYLATESHKYSTGGPTDVTQPEESITPEYEITTKEPKESETEHPSYHDTIPQKEITEIPEERFPTEQQGEVTVNIAPEEVNRVQESVTKAPEPPRSTQRGDDITEQPKISIPEGLTVKPEIDVSQTLIPEQPEPEQLQPEITTTGYSEITSITEQDHKSKDEENETEGPETFVTTQRLSTREPDITTITQQSEDKVSETTEAETDSSNITKLPQITEKTTEPEKEYSETTPYLVELEEHPHEIKESITTLLPSEESITQEPPGIYDTERGQVTEMSTQKPLQTETPLQYTEEDHIKSETIRTDAPTTISEEILEKSTEPSVSEEATSEPIKPPSLDEQVPDRRFTTETTDQENEISTVASVLPETKQTTQVPPETEKPNILVEENIPETTQDTLSSTAGTFETSTSEEKEVTAKTTTPKTDEGMGTQSPTEVDKYNKPETSTDVYPSVHPAETQKPVFSNMPPTDEAPQPDEESHFPPSGSYEPEPEPDYGEEFGPGTCRYGGKVYVSAQQIPRDDPCDFCFCFRSDIICLQQSCPPPIHGCHEEPIQGFCCPRYECPVSMATTLNVTTTTSTTTTTLPPHFLPHAYKGAAQRKGCQIKGHIYKVGEVVRASSGPCLHCTCGGDGQMKCDPKVCTPEPMLRQMIAAAVSAKRRR